jgi:large subunit ribosomal protein L10
MKTKAQKAVELEQGKELFAKSKAVLILDFSKVRTADIRNLRQELKSQGSRLVVLKKRLLGIILKEHNLPFENGAFKTSVGTVFAADLETASSAVYKFFKGLEKEKKIDAPKILGGFDLTAKTAMDAAYVTMVGALPPREALLGQLLGMLAAPIRSFLYVLDQKSKQSA